MSLPSESSNVGRRRSAIGVGRVGSVVLFRGRRRKVRACLGQGRGRPHGCRRCAGPDWLRCRRNSAAPSTSQAPTSGGATSAASANPTSQTATAGAAATAVAAATSTPRTKSTSSAPAPGSRTTPGVQLIDGGRVSVRAVATGATCPTITLNGTTSTMPARAAAGGRNSRSPYASRCSPPPRHRSPSTGTRCPCRWPRVPNSTASPSSATPGADWSLPSRCRTATAPRSGRRSPASDEIAQRSPELIIHTGDYYYRMVQCPQADQAECGGSP